MAKKAIEKTLQVDPIPEEINKTVIGRVNVPLLNVRKNASLGSDIMETISNDHEVEIVNEIDNFYKIKTFVSGKELNGYVVKEFITIE